MAGHGSPPPGDRGNHPGRVVTRPGSNPGFYNPTPLHPDVVEGIRQKVAKNMARRAYDEDAIAEGRQLNREALEDR